MKTTYLFTALLAGLPVIGSAHESHEHHHAEAEADAAMVALRAAAEGESATADDWVRLGDALMQDARDTLSHDFTAAGEAYQAALEQSPDHPDAVLGMAWVRNSEHNFKAGKEWAEKALEIDPRCLRAHSLLGDGAMELGEYDAAYDHIQAALDIRSNLSTLSRAAHLLWLTGDATRAQALMVRAIRSGGTEPEHEAWCRGELARMQLKTGATTAAEQQAEKAVKLAPQNPRVLVSLAMVRESQGRHEEAIDLYQRSVDLNPTHEALDGLVVLHQILGNETEAEKHRKGLLRFHDHDHGHHHGHGHSHEHVGGSFQLALFMAEQGMDAGEAKHEAEHAYEAFSNLAAADALAWCAYQKGELKLAQRMARRALKWGTSEPSFHYHAGMIEAKAGNVSAARRHLSQALSLNPSFDPVDAGRARAELERLAGAPK